MSAIAAARIRITGHWEVAIQALRAARRTLSIWAAAFAGLIALYAVIWPSVRGNTSWRNLFDTLPQTYRALFTASGTIDLSTAGGYLGVELMGFMGPALIAVYAITAGSAAIAGEEDRGGLEVTLSAPVSRTRVFGQRFAALVIGIATLIIATGVVLWIFSAMLGMGLGLGAIASAAAALGIFGLFAGAVAIAVGAATGSPAVARGVAALAVVASYLINALAQVTSTLRPARPISPYYLVLGNEPLAHGLQLTGAVSVLASKPVSGLKIEPTAMGPGLREWFGSLGRYPVKAAAFDTRMRGPAALTGRASKGVARLLCAHGFEVITEPESFLVTKQDRLASGELTRAREWGTMLAGAIMPGRARDSAPAAP